MRLSYVPRVVFVSVFWGASICGAQIPTEPSEMYGAWCASCHALDGTGLVEIPTVTVEPMDFTDCAVTTSEPDADWELVIAHGGPIAGLSSQMPGYGDTLSPEQIQALMGYVRSFCDELGWPMGNLNFSRPIFTEKAFPENEVVIVPSVSHKADGGTDLRLRTVYERRIGRRGQAEISLPVQSFADGSRRTSGFGDFTVAGKYVLHTNAASTRILSGGLEVKFPTGSELSGLGGGTTVLEPYLSSGISVRDFIIQGQVKLELPVGGASDEMEFVYNLYGGKDLSGLPSTWTVGAELNGVSDRLAITPQIRKGITRTGAIAIALGVRIPILNRQRQHVQGVGYLIWEYLDPIRAAP